MGATGNIAWLATTVPRSARRGGEGRDSLVALYISSHLADISISSQ